MPSPSSVTRCTRQNWFKSKGVPRTEPLDAETAVAQESGRLTESLLTALLEEAGFGTMEFDPTDEAQRELKPKALKSYNLRGGQLDNAITLNEPWASKYGEVALVELKRKSVFAFLQLVRTGRVMEGAPEDYAQLQALMAATGRRYALYFAVNWDRGALTKATRGKPRPDGFYLEWVPFNDAAVSGVAGRAEMQGGWIDGPADASKVPYDHTPGKDWQCDWCGWRAACEAASGGVA